MEPQINWKQVMGCLSIASISFAGGIFVSYTSALIPALQDSTSDIPTTLDQGAWLASISWLSSPVGATLGGYLMERFGRRTTVQLTIIPFTTSWILTATSRHYAAILIARIIIGSAYAVAYGPAMVLVAETALKNIRGPMSSIPLAIYATGSLCGYIMGAFLQWRTYAWVAALLGFIPFVLTCIFCVESPVWLRSRGQIEKAQKASLYYYGDPNYVVQPVTLQDPQRNTEMNVNTEQKNGPITPNFLRQLWMLFTSPSGFKPLFILNVMTFFQNWTGIYIILVYTVTFFQEAGSAIDAYYATIMVGVIKMFASFLTIFLVSRCNRRTLILVSTVGMAVCMVASAYATNLTLIEREGGLKSPFPSWFALTCVVTYNLATTIGLQTIPWTMAAELFPQRVRGAAQAVVVLFADFFGFVSLQAYPWMNLNLGGAVGLQYFFAATSILSTIFVWIFCPETHGKTLNEIEDYFTKNTVYLGHKEITYEQSPL